MGNNVCANETAAICGLFCGICSFYPDRCHGCLSNKLTAHCVSCPNGFRLCAKEHGVIRCYECREFPCERLERFSKEHFENGIGHHARVIEDLEFMRDEGIESWIGKMEKEYTCPKCKKLIYWYDVNNHVCR